MIDAARTLSERVEAMRFAPPIAAVYNPLSYAWSVHQAYLERFGGTPKHVLFLGMNPGPFGMAQTGVPFGEIAAVRDWMKLDGVVGCPKDLHPKRPVDGFACGKSEVSGRRLWGLMADRFGSPEVFFKDHFVANFCPLVFMDEGGRNITPDKLPRLEQVTLFKACDDHLQSIIHSLNPKWCIGVGAFATKCFSRVDCGQAGIGSILHPSPASPAANRGWAEAAAKQLVDLGVWSA